MKSTFPRNLQFKETTTGQQGHGETRQHSEVTEGEDVSAERRTKGNQTVSEPGLTDRMETDNSSSGTSQGEECKAEQHNSRRDTDGTGPKPQGNPQNIPLLPSFFVTPICTGIPGSPPYKLIPIKREVTNPVPPKKENRSEGVDFYTALENHKCVPEDTVKLPVRPPCGTQKPRNPKNLLNATLRSVRLQRSTTEPPSEPQIPKPLTELSSGNIVDQLTAGSAGGGGEVNEKLVYVVEEKGKNVTKVETDLFTLNEILTIKKDLLELSEFAKKLKQLKERNKPQEVAKAEGDNCRCEPTSDILKDVNKRIEALEMKQEELEKGKKSIQKEMKMSSSSPREPAKPTVNVVMPAQTKVKPTGSRRGPPPAEAQDLVNELMDIQKQLKRLEERRYPKLEEMPVEWVDSSEVGWTVRRSTALMKDVCSRDVKPKKDGAVTVFSGKTYIFSPDKLGSKRKETKGTESKSLGEKLGFEETKIINWLKGVCSRGSVLLKPSPTIVEESQTEGKVEFTCKNCSGPVEEMGALENQEPQKNRARHKDSIKDDFLKKESSSRKVVKKRSYKECFVSPSGRFFAWMKRSSDKVKKNFCSDWPQTKVLQKVQPKQISRTTSTRSIVKESPRKGVRCPVLSDTSLSGNLQDFVRVVCKSEKTAMNENMKCLGKKGWRSLSKDKLQKEDKNEAVRRQEPRWVKPRKSSDLTLSSSFSEIMDTIDFDLSSNSLDGSRWQRSNEFHAQVFSCFTQPDYLVDTCHRRTEWYRETEKERRKREKKERKAVQKLQKKTAKMKKSCDKRRRKLAKKEDEYASRCIIEGCDFGKDYWRRYSPVQSVHQLLPQSTVRASKDISRDTYRPNVYKKAECLPVKESCESGRFSGQNYFEKEETTCTETSEDSLQDPKKCQPERIKSVLSAERPSFERNTLRDFFKNFGWMYPRVGEYRGECQDRKKVEHEECEERATKDVRKRREKDECPEGNVLKTKEYDHEFRSTRSCASDNERPQRNPPHNHDPDHVETCDCVRLYLQTQVEKKLEALRNAHISSTDTAVTDTSKSEFDRTKLDVYLPRSENLNRTKQCIKREANVPKAKHHTKKDFEYISRQECVPKPENCVESDPITQQRRPTEPEPHNKMGLEAKEHIPKDHPKRCMRKIRHRDGHFECFCQFCGTAPCLIEEKCDIPKRKSSENTQQELPGGVSCPRKEPCKPYCRRPQEKTVLSNLCHLWKKKNCQPVGMQNPKTLAVSPPETASFRYNVKPVCNRFDLRPRNVLGKPWCLEKISSPPEVCIFRESCAEAKKVPGSPGRPSPKMSGQPPNHAHCFLVNSDNSMTRANLLCFPENSNRRGRCRRRAREDCVGEERRDQAIECHFIRDSQDVTDKTTETEDVRSTSCEKINRKNIKDRLASLHCLWKNLQKCTIQKARFGREIGRCIRRRAVASLSGLDTYDCWWSDTWPKPRRHGYCGRRCTGEGQGELGC